MNLRRHRAILVAVILIAAIAISTILARTRTLVSAAPIGSGMKWEYKSRVHFGRISDPGNSEMYPSLKTEIELFGANGWELVTVYDDERRAVFIYKRAK